MAERRDSADRVAGGRAGSVRVRLGHRFPGDRRKAALIEPVGSADQRDHRPAGCDEDKRLHDLTHVAPDRARGVHRGARALGKLPHRHPEVRARQPRLESVHGYKR